MTTSTYTTSLTVVLGEAALQGAEDALPNLVVSKFASRLANQDPTLWGDDAEQEASIRLGWVTLPRESTKLLEAVTALRTSLEQEGLNRFVLCGMGGSSLAPEVFAQTFNKELIVLDSTDPDQVRAALTDLDRTVVIVASKSGSTVETDSQRRAFDSAFTAAGINPARRFIAITDPGSALARLASEQQYRALIEADPLVGGRYSALSAFGLVPAGLLGIDISHLLEEARAVTEALAADDADNPALLLGAALANTDPARSVAVVVDQPVSNCGIPLAPWVEQLVAESTGKNGTGVLPVVVASEHAPEVVRPPGDVLVIRHHHIEEPPSPAAAEVVVSGTLGGLIQLWETATAVAGHLLGINPFDQPDVESAKVAARALLNADQHDSVPESEMGWESRIIDDIDVTFTHQLLQGASTLQEAIDVLLAKVDPTGGYLAVMAYLNRTGHPHLPQVRETLAERLQRPVTFGWGPRFLHSTGQFHKGGPAEGVFLQITADAENDLPIDGQPFTFGELIAAQARGDAHVLANHGMPVLRLHLRDVRRQLPLVIHAMEATR